MTKKVFVSIEEFKQLEQRLESLLKAFRGSHEAGKMCCQKVDVLEGKVNEIDEKLGDLEETCENLKGNPKYSILTEGEYDYIENGLTEDNIVKLESKKQINENDAKENEIQYLEKEKMNNEIEIRRIDERIKALESEQVSFKSMMTSCENMTRKMLVILSVFQVM